MTRVESVIVSGLPGELGVSAQRVVTLVDRFELGITYRRPQEGENHALVVTEKGEIAIKLLVLPSGRGHQQLHPHLLQHEELRQQLEELPPLEGQQQPEGQLQQEGQPHPEGHPSQQPQEGQQLEGSLSQ